MGVKTKIQWTHHSWNPWRGCQKVSPGCTHCYAETMSHRNPAVLGTWGPNGTRVVASPAKWREPLAWDRAAEKAGERHRVFPSLCDPLEDRPELDEPLGRYLELIARTQSLDHLLLTKRPGLWSDRLHAVVRNYHGGTYEHERGLPTGDVIAAAWLDGEAPPNLWAGVSVEDQARANERIPELLRIPAAVRFLSVEPLLGPIDLGHVRHQLAGGSYEVASVLSSDDGFGLNAPRNRIDWVIVGGESGPRARPCDIDWIRSIVRQCKAAGVHCFVKQIGSHPLDYDAPPGKLGVLLRDRKGGDISEFPEDLQVREFPHV